MRALEGRGGGPGALAPRAAPALYAGATAARHSIHYYTFTPINYTSYIAIITHKFGKPIANRILQCVHTFITPL